ncbi:MAG: lipid-binding SYLF domain-containing protein [Candidatus Eisenbacteria bacterium]|uniref:Lipid-binding SYLF domain-containing protein n=1 Tax=Eiseniibacteriota bacterium TaxID=2212470 RepID=A0A849SUI2_UNCEI|nr:lipid-binding SYLF domain-containing protein [Candidatus Eisenbacteria bacterium]
MLTLQSVVALMTGFAAVDLGSPRVVATGSESPDQQLRAAAAACRELLGTRPGPMSRGLLEKCRSVVVIPRASMAAKGFGGHHGSGVLSCRNPWGAWSPPSFVGITSGGWAPSMMPEASDLVVFSTSDAWARSLSSNGRVTLSGVTRGSTWSFGRNAELECRDTVAVETHCFAKSNGRFAERSFRRAQLAVDTKANSAYYGEALTFQDLLFQYPAPSLSDEAMRFCSALD